VSAAPWGTQLTRPILLEQWNLRRSDGMSMCLDEGDNECMRNFGVKTHLEDQEGDGRISSPPPHISTITKSLT
jgi:hypothetical protein